MRHFLKVVRDTVLKKRPINSSELPDNEKHPISIGEYELHSWVDFDEDDNHWRVAFLNDRFHDSNTWLVYTGHVEIWKDDIMIRPLFPATSTLLKDYQPCGTAGLNGLDLQIIAVMNELTPGSLVDCSDLNISVSGPQVHPFVQAEAKKQLAKAIQKGGRRLRINSCYRTIAQQLLLWNHRHKKQGGCNYSHPPPCRHQLNNRNWRGSNALTPISDRQRNKSPRIQFSETTSFNDAQQRTVSQATLTGASSIANVPGNNCVS